MTKCSITLTHLDRLEAESIHVMREVVAETKRPVMLYSIGKDSAVMLHLARKAFHPAPPPFPLLHVDTTWKFKDMYALRDRMARESGMELLVYHNPAAMEQGVNPCEQGPLHTDLWKTEGLKQALDKYGFDAAFGGARRGGQYEWDSCAPAAVAIAAGLHVSRADGSQLTYNNRDTYLLDLLICPNELADRVLGLVRAAQLSPAQPAAAG